MFALLVTVATFGLLISRDGRRRDDTADFGEWHRTEWRRESRHDVRDTATDWRQAVTLII